MDGEPRTNPDVPRVDDVETWTHSGLQAFLQALFFVLIVRPFVLLFLGLRIRDRGRIPAGRRPFILIANHSSHLDTACLLNLFPIRRLRHLRPVAAADYFERNPFVSKLTRTLFHILPIDRTARRKDASGQTGADPRQRMLAALQAGQSLILFPEGTRGNANEVTRFRSGIAWLAQAMPEVPIVPIYLANLGRALPKGHFVPIPLFVEVRVGEPLLPRGDREEIRAALESAVKKLKDTP